MTAHHFTLLEILTTVAPTNIPVAHAQALAQFQEEAQDFLAAHYRLGPDLVCPPLVMGSKVKGTATAMDHDTELVLVFRHEFWQNAPRMKAGVLHALEHHFGSRRTEVREQRFSVGLRRLLGTQTLALNVLPGLESLPESYHYDSEDEEQKYLLLHDKVAGSPRPANLHRQARRIRSMGAYTDVVRLLKAWRHQQGHLIGTCALELMVHAASQAPEAVAATNLAEQLRHVLRFAIPILEADLPLMDIGIQQPWPDYLTPNGKLQLASKWKRLLAALQSTDSHRLRGFFIS